MENTLSRSFRYIISKKSIPWHLRLNLSNYSLGTNYLYDLNLKRYEPVRAYKRLK